MRVLACFAIAMGSVLSVADAQAPRARWTVDAQPVVTIGQNDADTNAIFAVVAGATRLPDGRILVGDRGNFSLRIFTPNGKQERAFGRKGKGPGEISYLASMLRCGDSIVTVDIDGHRTSVFSIDGTYVRAFRFGSAQPGRRPYRTVCNDRGLFAHHGWEEKMDLKGGVFRPDVPFWVSAGDSAVRGIVGWFPGVERLGQVVGGQMRGSRPLPLGKIPALALGSDRLYIGSADRYEILAFDLAGRRVAIIRDDQRPRSVTDDDIDFAKQLEVAEGGERIRAAVERSWAAIPFPKTVPAHAAVRLDAAGNLWVQDYPRPASPTVMWRVFGQDGAHVAHVDLPTYLDVYEIGSDYVLGRYLDPDESIPQVRLYRLTRAAR